MITQRRRLDFVLRPERECFTTESLVPGEHPNSPTSEDGIRAKVTYWLSEPSIVGWRKLRMEMLLSRLPERMAGVVLDFGCFFGEATEALAARWPEAKIVGCDIGFPAARITRERTGTTTVVFPPSQVPIKPHSLSAVVLADVAEHLRELDWLWALNELRRATKPGGRLFVHCPVADFLVGKPVHLVISKYMLGENHPAMKSLAYLRESVGECGWHDVRAEHCAENWTYGFCSAMR